MTDEQMRIKIAEACETMKWSYALPTKTIHCDVPNYPKDLNACHEMEKAFSAIFNACDEIRILTKYEEILMDICGGFGHFMATPRQRCEAFLRTLGL